MYKHKQIEERLQRLNLLLRTMRNVDHVILAEKDRDSLLQGVCQSLVKTRGYYNVWIALLDDAGRFTTFAEAGLGQNFMPLVKQLKRDGATRCGQTALAQKSAVVINDPASSCIDCPLAEEYSGRGGITARLQHRGILYGLLCASVPASLVTEEEERSLFEDIASDIAFALHKIEVEEERERAEKALRAYASRAISAQEEERKRIARELHDETAQDLASLGMDIDYLAKTKGGIPVDLSKRLGELRDRTNDILRGVRSMSQALRPPMLEEFGLVSALQGLVIELNTQYEIDARLEVQGTARRLSPDVEITLFRIAQEALNNVGKHSRTTECQFEIEYSPNNVRLIISDNGQGFDLPGNIEEFASSKKLGLVGMQERAKLIDGTLTIQSERGKGTTLVLEV